ncbi:uncharacterized protein Dana_GF27936 [Drosophila ananassae]|uniref:Uncharacterized protein n=1 Tax=Drosophila ananassae TaxID=7217 RepID=A0A0P9APD9_DROAN|nr:protein phosphatase 1 regulatory subunit 12A [Drosophila ananassae]KPU79545.1 uncharacterized protein Dana_GF27936 [Drosophila ananassae]
MSGIVLTGIAACRRSSFYLGLWRVSYRHRCGLSGSLASIQPRRRKHDGSKTVSGKSDGTKTKDPGSTRPILPIHMGPGFIHEGPKEEPGKGAGGAAPPNPTEVPAERRPEAPFENSPELPSARPSPVEVKPQGPNTITCFSDNQDSGVHSPNTIFFQLGQLDVKSSNEGNNENFDGKFQSNPAQPPVEFINDPRYDNGPIYYELGSDSQTPKDPNNKDKSKGFIGSSEDIIYTKFFPNEPVSPEELRIRAALQALSEEEQAAKRKNKRKAKAKLDKTASKEPPNEVDAKEEPHTPDYIPAEAKSETAFPLPPVPPPPSISSAPARRVPQNPDKKLSSKPNLDKKEAVSRTGASNQNLRIKSTPARKAGAQTPFKSGTSAGNSERSSAKNQAIGVNPKSSSFDLPGERKTAGPLRKTGQPSSSPKTLHPKPSSFSTPSDKDLTNQSQPPKEKYFIRPSNNNNFGQFWRPNDSKEGADQSGYQGGASGFPGDEAAVNSEAGNWRLQDGPKGKGTRERTPDEIAREVLSLIKASQTSARGTLETNQANTNAAQPVSEIRNDNRDQSSSELFKQIYEHIRTEEHKQPAEEFLTNDYVQKWIEKYKVQLEKNQAKDSDARPKVIVKKTMDEPRRTIQADPDSPYACMKQVSPDSFKDKTVVKSTVKPISSSDLMSDRGSPMNLVGVDAKPVEFIHNEFLSQQQSSNQIISMFKETGGTTNQFWKMGSTKKEDSKPKTTEEIVAMFKDDSGGDQTKAQEGRVRELFEQLDKFDKGQDRWWTLEDLSKATKTSQAEVRAILASDSSNKNKTTKIETSEFKSSKETDPANKNNSTGISTSETKSSKEVDSTDKNKPTGLTTSEFKTSKETDSTDKNKPTGIATSESKTSKEFLSMAPANKNNPTGVSTSEVKSTKENNPIGVSTSEAKSTKETDSTNKNNTTGASTSDAKSSNETDLASKINPIGIATSEALSKLENPPKKDPVPKDSPKASLDDDDEGGIDHFSGLNDLNTKIRAPTLKDLVDEKIQEEEEDRAKLLAMNSKIDDEDFVIKKDDKKKYMKEIAKLKDELEEKEDYNKKNTELSKKISSFMEAAEERRKKMKDDQTAKFSGSDDMDDYQPKSELIPGDLYDPIASEVSSHYDGSADGEDDNKLIEDEMDPKTKGSLDETKTKVDEKNKKPDTSDKNKPELDRGELALKLLDKETAKPPADVLPSRPSEKSFLQILFDKFLGSNKKGDDPKRKMSTYVGRRHFSTTATLDIPSRLPFAKEKSHCSLQEPLLPQSSFNMFKKKDKKKKSKDLTEIQGGSPLCKNPKKTPRELLKEKNQSRDIKILGGSPPCAEKLDSLEDDDCNTQKFSNGVSGFARQIWLSIFPDAIDRSTKAK